MVQVAAGFVDSERRVVAGVRGIGVGVEVLGIDDGVGECAAHDEGVAGHGPLRLAEHAQDLAEVVHEPGEDEPVRVTVSADALGGLQTVFDLGQAGVGVALANQAVESLAGPRIPIRVVFNAP